MRIFDKVTGKVRVANRILAISVVLTALGFLVSMDLMLLGVLCMLGAVIVVGRERFLAFLAPENIVLLDGSNIMHWRDGVPRIETVREVVDHLVAQGYCPGVVFDANAGYKLNGEYQHHQVLARLLKMPSSQVIVVNKGEAADGILLRMAQEFPARVVSNDRFRDWTVAFPEVAEPGHVITGRYRDGKLQLDLA